MARASKNMGKEFIQMTSGWIPVLVLVLLAVALVAGQARANLPLEAVAISAPAAKASIDVVLNRDILKKLETLPGVVDSMFVLPSKLELRFETRLERGDLASDQILRRLKK